jgi:hypothetical protein
MMILPVSRVMKFCSGTGSLSVNTMQGFLQNRAAIDSPTPKPAMSEGR